MWHVTELVYVKQDEKWKYFECPFCISTDHYAVMAINNLEIRPLHCYHKSTMGWVDTRMGNIIKDVLLQEEIKFRVHLEKFNNLEGPIDPVTGFKMRTGGGCPDEIIRELVSDVKEYERLLEEDKEKSRIKRNIY